jgi:hypothetical protein
MAIACKQGVGLFALLFFLCMAKVAAQPRAKVEYYSTENGLSHQAVTCILKDREGFMWFGTWDGINRFDGNNFVSYKSLPGDGSQLGNGRIDRMMEDQAGHLWIEAYDRQIYRFDKKIGQFTPLAPFINPTGRQKVNFNRICRQILLSGIKKEWKPHTSCLRTRSIFFMKTATSGSGLELPRG